MEENLMTNSAIAHQIDEGEWCFIPLSKLIRAAGNVRKVKAALADERDESSALTPMQHSIVALGMLQNLIVVERSDGNYDVWGGGERLQNLQDLREKGAIDPDHKLMCRVMPEAQARAASLAENKHRSAMHPADEFDAMSLMINEEKRTTEEVAQIFGMTPGSVTRRMRLAAVSPKIMAEFREGRANLDQMMAMTLVQADHAGQEQLYFGLPVHMRSAAKLRELATSGEVSLATDYMAKFVGLDDYVAAGGAFRKDLFEESLVFLEDRALVNKLAMQKLEAYADQVRAEGWSWVEVVPAVTYTTYSPFTRTYRKARPYTAEEEARGQELKTQLDSLNAQYEALGDEEDSEPIETEISAIENQLEDLNEGRYEFSPEDYKLGGAIVGLQYGRLEVERGLLKKGVRAVGADGTTEKVVKLSERMCRQLSAHRTAALQVAIASDPKLALVATVHRLAMRVVHGDMWYDGKLPVNVDAERTSQLEDFAPDYVGSIAYVALEKIAAPWRKKLPKEPAKLYAALLKMSVEDLNKLLAVCVSFTVEAVTSNPTEGDSGADILAKTCKLDMRKGWEATAESYFKHVPKPLILAAVGEFAPDQVPRLADLKKSDLASEAEKLAKGKGWLPAILKAHEAEK